MLTNLNYRFTIINSRFCRILGCGERDLLAHPFNIVILPEQLEEDVSYSHRSWNGLR
ncbi:MAG: PAS domain-containing protein [Candidatus Odinarchaeota archaeon]